MKTNANDSVYPTTLEGEKAKTISGNLSKREYFASVALQGITSARANIKTMDVVALREWSAWSVVLADELIKELNKGK